MKTLTKLMLLVSFIAVSVIGNIAVAQTISEAFCTTPYLGAASNAIDGNGGTRWESLHEDHGQWLMLKLDQVYTLSHVDIDWQNANAEEYGIFISTDSITWDSVGGKVGMSSGNRTDVVEISGDALYVKVNCNVRATPWGYSIWEIGVRGVPQGHVSTLTTIELTADKSVIEPSENLTITATGYDQAGYWMAINPTWTTTGGTVTNGVFASASKGVYSVTATDGSVSDTYEVTVADPQLTISSSSASSGTASAAFDDNSGTRWESTHGVDPQWLQVDFGGVKKISRVIIDWQNANAKDYTLEISNDGTNWQTIKTIVDAAGGERTDEYNVVASAQYMRVYGTARTTVYGYSIWEMKIFGVTDASLALTTATLSAPKSMILKDYELQIDIAGEDQNGDTYAVAPTWSTSGGTVSTTGLFSSSSTGLFTITATDGSVSDDIDIQVVLTLPSDTACLSDLMVEGETVADFDSATYIYTVVLPYDATDVPTVTATKYDSKANAVVTPAATLNDTTYVVVTAEDNTTKLTYKVAWLIEARPTTAAQTPPNKNSNEVISVFSDAYTKISGTDYDPNWGQDTEVSFDSIIANDGVLKYANFNYQGTQLGVRKDVTSMDTLHVDIWTADDTDVSVTPINNSSLTPREALFTLSPVANQWNSYDILLSEFTDAGMNLDSVIQMKFTCSNSGALVYLDNIFFYTEIEDGTDATLSDLKLDNKTINSFDATTMVYDTVLPQGSTVVPTVTATTTDEYANAVITEATSLPGTTTIVVTADDDVTTKTYKVNFTVFVPDAAPTTAAPTAPAREATDVISIFSGAYTDVTGTNFIPNWSGQSTIPSTETIESNSTLKYKNLNYQGIEFGSDQDASNMEFLHLDVWTADATTLKITPISRSTSEHLVDVSPVVHDEWKSYDIPLSEFTDNDMSLADLYQLKFTESGSASLIYVDNIYFYRIPKTDATLSDLQVDNATITGFKADSLSYEIVLPYGTETVPTVTATTTDNAADAVITAATELPGTTNVVVTAEDGTTTITYEVKFTVVAANVDASLSDLKVDETTIENFAATTFNYAMELPFGTSTVPSVTATATNAEANVEVTAATSLPDTTVIVVTAQDGTTTSTYKVAFNLEKGSSNADLSSLLIDGAAIEGFKADSLNYNIVLPVGTATIPVISSVVADTTASTEITQATALPGNAIVEVTAQDGATKKTYKVSFSVAAASANAKLADLQMDGLTLLEFNTDTLMYNSELPYGSTDIPVISASATDTNANVVVTQATTLPGSAKVEVTAQDNETSLTYTVNFTVSEFVSDDASLRDIKVNEASITNFESSKYSYIVTLPYGTESVPEIEGVSTNTAAQVVINNASTLSDTTVILVTAQDSTTIKSYMVSFIIADPVYDVAFTVVNADSIALEGAQVVFMLDTLTTGINGKVMFEAVTPTTSVAYKIQKEGYFDAIGTIDVDQDIDKTIVLQLEAYPVKFMVTDANNAIIEGAELVFQNDTLLTDTAGMVMFSAVTPVNDAKYSLSKQGYIDVSGTVSVSDTAVDVSVTMELLAYEVKFVVVDANDNAIADADVALLEKTVKTNASGLAVFESVVPVADAAYTVTKEGFVAAEGSITVADSNVLENVVLQTQTYEVTFTVTDSDNNLVADADVVFQGNTVLTSAEGLAKFSSVAPVDNEVYSVSKDGYEAASGTVTVVDADVNISVQLITVGINRNANIISNIYPNPTEGLLNIELAKSFTSAFVQVYDIQGQIVDRIELNTIQSQIDLSYNKSGLYLIKVSVDGEVYSSSVVIK